MLGVDISDRSIKVVEIAPAHGAAKLTTACWSALPANLMRRGIIQDIPSVTDFLQQTLTQCSPRPVEGEEAVVSIPEIQSFVRVIELPPMTDMEIGEAVQWAVRQHIPFDLERVYLDWQPLAPVAGATRLPVLVGAAQREVIDPLLQVVDQAGLRAVAFELEAQAIVRSLLPRESTDVTGVLLVDLGATSTNIIFFDRGAMRFTTSIQRGGDDLTQQLSRQLNLQPSVAAAKKAEVGVRTDLADAAVVASLRASTLSLVQQIHQVVQEYTFQLQAGQGLRAILLAGGSANLPGITDVFSEVFPGIPVQLGNPWVNLTLDERQDQAPVLAAEDAPHFTTAIGLALRQPEHVAV